jgi:Bacterial Ig domain
MSLSTRNSLAMFVALVATLSALGGPADPTAKIEPTPFGEVEFCMGPDDGPVIMSVLVGNLPLGRVALAGFAQDDESLLGCHAYIVGDGVNKTAIILLDGTFATTFQRPTRREFTVTVTVVDADGNISDPVDVVVPGI